MSTRAQILANQANAQLSTGPRSEEGKAISSKNNLRHGLTGPFMVLAWEKKHEYEQLKADLFAEHQPTTLTEQMLVEDMAQSHWLRKRAITMQTLCFRPDKPDADQPKELLLYLRYQTTHDRAFYRALNELQKLRAQKRKEQIGFVSQERRQLEEQRKEAREKRRENEEIRRQEMHQARLSLTEAQAKRHETEASVRKTEPNAAEAAKIAS
jgi:hypothetical protein